MPETEEMSVIKREPDAIERVKPILTVDDVLAQRQLVLDVMTRAMKKNVHYGIIPGCKKPSLLQPGAEIICTLFQLAPTYEVLATERDTAAERAWTKKTKQGKVYSGVCKGFTRYTVRCRLVHRATDTAVAEGLGVASNWEPKFISRDPFESEETVIQFARKRALVNAARTATAASDVFTQDVEDMESLDDADSAREHNAETLKDDLSARMEQDAAAAKGATGADVDAGEGAGNQSVESALHTAAPPARAAASLHVPPCPVCGGEMWDNRKSRRSAKAPLWKCKAGGYDAATKEATGCTGALWSHHEAIRAVCHARSLSGKIIAGLLDQLFGLRPELTKEAIEKAVAAMTDVQCDSLLEEFARE